MTLDTTVIAKTTSVTRERSVTEMDTNGDGLVVDSELSRAERAQDVFLREEKAAAQKKLAWAAMLAMILFTGLLYLPFIPQERVESMGALLGVFYVTMSGVIAAYFGVSAWLSTRP